MYKSPNEIVLETQVLELKKELEALQKFEMDIGMAFTQMLMGIMMSNNDTASKALDKMKDLIGERAADHIIRDRKKRG
jgi:hypothetical protein